MREQTWQHNIRQLLGNHSCHHSSPSASSNNSEMVGKAAVNLRFSWWKELLHAAMSGKYIYSMTRRDPQKHIRSVVYPCRPIVQWWLEHQLQQKCLTENWPQGDTRCEHESSARLQDKMRPFKQCTLGYFILKPFIKKSQKLGSVFVCTFAGRVQQGGLKRDHLNVVQVFVNGHLNSKTGIWVHIGKGQQVCGTHKEVSMERVDGKTCRGKEWGGGNWSTFKMQQLLNPKFEVESCTSSDVLD